MKVVQLMKIDELKLLSGQPIKFYDIGYVHPFTIKDIEIIGGEEQFNLYLNTMLISKEALSNQNDSNELSDFTNFEIIFLLAIRDSEFRKIFLDALSFVFKEDITINDYGIFVGDISRAKVINNDNYDEFAHIIKIQNCLEKQEKDDEEDNPSNDKAKELLEKRRKARQKINEIKNKDSDIDGEPLTLSDLVSILAANGNGINIFNVWDLSFYAFNDQFNRMKMLEDYQINIQSLLAGANADDIKMKHWMSKIS